MHWASGENLLQVRDEILYPRNEAPGTAVLLLIAFARKGLTRMETHYSNVKREVLGILHGP